MAIDLGDIPTGTPPTAGEKLQIRSAIGVGQTDAPTFLAQTLTGQSLTGTQATSLVDLAATWNTTGNPSLIYGRVTNTNSGTTANLIDLGTFAGGTLFKVTKSGALNASGYVATSAGGISLSGGGLWQLTAGHLTLKDVAILGWSGGSDVNVDQPGDLRLYRDAAGILAQRNGVNAQAFRVYNTDPVGGAKEWFEINWQPTGTNSVKIGTALAGGGAARPIDFVTGGVARWQISAAGDLLASTNNSLDIGANAGNKPRNIYAGSAVKAQYFQTNISSSYLQFGSDAYIGGGGADGVILLSNNASSSFTRLQFGGALNSHPAIARDGAGIQFTGAAAGSTSWIKVPDVAVSALPSAATAGVGARSFVNDALAPTFGSAVASGGSAKVPVYSDGTNWNVG